MKNGETQDKICPFEDKKILVNRVGEFCIDGTSVSSIFNEAKYDISSVCIL
jgi:hypothetical protein